MDGRRRARDEPLGDGVRRAASGRIELDFPARPSTVVDAPAGLCEALGQPAVETRRAGDDLLVVLASDDAVRGLAPDTARVGALPVRAVMVTARSASGGPFDFVSRFFAPRVGVAEDPVTGSAHGCLAVYWGERLGKAEMVAYQASPRGGVLHLRLGDARVVLGREAITVLDGELRV